MTYTSIPDNFNDRQDLDECSRSARLLHVELYVFANLTGRDGRIPITKLRRLTDSDDPQRDLEELLEHDRDVQMDGDVIVLEWKDQRTAARIEELIVQGRERKARWNAKKEKRQKLHASGDHMLCSADYCTKAGTRSGTHDGTALIPDPTTTRPDRKGGVGSGALGFAGAPPAPRRGVEAHAYLDDGSGLSCEACPLPKENPAHSIADEEKSA